MCLPRSYPALACVALPEYEKHARGGAHPPVILNHLRLMKHVYDELKAQ